MERGGESEPRNGVRCVLEIINFLEDRSLDGARRGIFIVFLIRDC